MKSLRIMHMMFAVPLLILTGLVLVGTPLTSAARQKKSAEPKAASKPDSPPPSTRRDPAPIAAQIDREIDKLLAENKIPASPEADDAEFIRRASLDIRGRIPHAERVRAFLGDSRPDRRALLIDEFLADPEYGEHFAVTWYHRMVKVTGDNHGAVNGNRLHDWLADSFNKNHGWNRMVTTLLTASGSRGQNPETALWLACIGDEKIGQPDPNLATAAASRLFMGVRLECCECHNHPFSTLKQTDFWGVAAFFAQTHAESANKKAVKQNAEPKIFEKASFAPKKKKKALESKDPIAPFGSIAIPFGDGKIVRAKYLGGATPNLTGKDTLRPVFAAWLTAPKNPYFARAAVNMLWGNFFGRGIVNPMDDMLTEAKNTHPELLTLLAEEFAAGEFDQKHLIRCICNSKTYQRTSRPLAENKEDDALYSRMPLKVMTADMLYDSLAVALSRRVPGTETKYPKKKTVGPREEFRKFFHAEADDDAGVVEDYGHGIPQVLRLMNSRQLIDPSATVARLMRVKSRPEDVIDGLYLAVLSRRPSDAEMNRARKYIAADNNSAVRYGELMWAMLNTSEFLFNH